MPLIFPFSFINNRFINFDLFPNMIIFFNPTLLFGPSTAEMNAHSNIRQGDEKIYFSFI